MQSMNSLNKNFPPSSLQNVELSSDLNRSNNNLEDNPLLLQIEHKPFNKDSSPESKFQTINWIIKVLILLGERSLWGFDQLMRMFCDRLRMRLLSTLPAFFQLFMVLFPNIVIPKEILEIFNYTIFTGLLLWIMSGIYHFLIGKRWSELISEISSDESCEVINELKEKYALISYLTDKALKIMQTQQGNVPNELRLALSLAREDQRILSNNLYVAPEFFGLYVGIGGNYYLLTPEEIDQIPIEIYSKSVADAEIDDEPNMCSICIKNFEKKEQLRRLPCGHKFHVKCVDVWLKQLAACPNCKVRVALE